MEEALEDLEYVIDFPNQPRDTIGNNYEIPSNLQGLSLINNRLRSITKLENCSSSLVNLCLRQNFITADNLSGLIPVAKVLIKLDLYENQIEGKGLSFFLTSQHPTLVFESLRYLDLSFNPIRQLDLVEINSEVVDTSTLRNGGPLSAFPCLEYLYFVECKMSRVPCLSHVPRLFSLELGGNRIREIERIEGLNSLKQLWLGKNKIVTIKNLNIPQLDILSLQANRIVKIEGLNHLNNLTQLYLSENGIEVIEGLESLINLKILDLEKNKISVIQGLETLTKLEELWLSYNNISSFNEVSKLKNFKCLDTVCLEHNPIYKDPQYRNKVLAELLQINQLDAIQAVRTNNPLIQHN